MMGRTRCHFASFFLGRQTPGLLSGFGAASVVRTAYLVPAGNSTLLQEAAHAARSACPCDPGELNTYRSAGDNSVALTSRM